MTGIFGERLAFSQEKGPEVELVVYGDEFYARYETAEGYSVIYDPNLGLFCYALVVDGKFVSSKIAISEPPPAGAALHGKESPAVREARISEKLASRNTTDPPR